MEEGQNVWVSQCGKILGVKGFVEVCVRERTVREECKKEK